VNVVDDEIDDDFAVMKLDNGFIRAAVAAAVVEVATVVEEEEQVLE
jgi:hypothetical protein